MAGCVTTRVDTHRPRPRRRLVRRGSCGTAPCGPLGIFQEQTGALSLLSSFRGKTRLAFPNDHACRSTCPRSRRHHRHRRTDEFCGACAARRDRRARDGHLYRRRDAHHRDRSGRPARRVVRGARALCAGPRGVCGCARPRNGARLAPSGRAGAPRGPKPRHAAQTAPPLSPEGAAGGLKTTEATSEQTITAPSDASLARRRAILEERDMKRSLATALAAALTLPAMAAGHDIRAGALHIDHPMAFATAPGVRAGGGYMTISNEGGTDDALIGVTADFPRVTLHRSVEEDGITRMEHVTRLDIPAGERVELAPGGYHVMFMGLTEPLEAG